MKKRILIVKVERIVAECMAQCLARAGYDIVGIAKSGEEAVRISGESKPDLILMDIVNRDDLDGIKTAAIIRERFKIPFIFLTVDSQEGVLERANAMEPLGYLVKPYEEASLVLAVETALHKAGLDRQLAHSLEWFYTTLKCIGDGVIAIGMDERITFMNNRAEELTGWKFEDANERMISEVFEIVNINTREKVNNPALVALRTEDIVTLDPDTVLVRQDGSELPIDDAGSPIRNSEGELIGSVLVFRDISKQYEAERAVKKYQEKMEREVAQRTAALSRRVNLESLVTSISLPLVRLQGDDLSRGLNSALRKLGESLNFDHCTLYQLKKTDSGHIFSVTHEWNSTATGTESARCLPDYTSMANSWWVAQVQQYGYILVNSLDDLPPEATVERELLEKIGNQSMIAIPFGGGDGVLTGSVVLGSSGEGDWNRDDVQILMTLGHFIDSIIDRARAEDERSRLASELIQSRKLEAIGKLSGGIAHDFNNMLVPIIGYSDVIIERMEADGECSEEISAIRDAAESAAALTRQLLSFARKQILKKSRVNLHEIVTGTQKLLQRLLGADISFELYSSPQTWSMIADRSQIEQILMNLCVNAGDAMKSGGSIIVNVENVTLSGGNYIYLSVEDTGPGMDRATLERIFEPFFSTKGNEGTGLGLSVVLGIVEQHEGRISVDSEPGRGSRFNIWIPAAEGAEVEEEIRPVTARSLAIGGQESILLIEDEASVLQFVSQALRKKGYQVETAMSVAEAFKVYEANGGVFDLIYSDAMLPDGTGMEIVGKLLAGDDSLRALLSSGYTDHRSLVDMANEQRIAFLHKPYSLPDLYKTVRAVLDGEESALLA